MMLGVNAGLAPDQKGGLAEAQPMGPAMIRLFAERDQKLVALPPETASIQNAIWIDMLRPRGEDEAMVENALGLDIPTQEEMREYDPLRDPSLSVL